MGLALDVGLRRLALVVEGVEVLLQTGSARCWRWPRGCLTKRFARDRLALLLRHFSEIKDDREPWRVLYPLAEVMLLVVCGTICSGDDFDDIVGPWSLGRTDRARRAVDEAPALAQPRLQPKAASSRLSLIHRAEL